MRCVMLGGAGFLGRHVGRAMAAAGYEVWSVDRARAEPEGSAPWLAGEVLADGADVATWWPACGDADVVQGDGDGAHAGFSYLSSSQEAGSAAASAYQRSISGCARMAAT